MSDELDRDETTPEERRLADLFRSVEAPASMRRWESSGARRGAGARRWWSRLLLAPITVGGERRLRPLAAALVLPLLVLAVGGGLQLRAHFDSGTAVGGPGGPGSPTAREDATMAFDAARGVSVLFGGSDSRQLLRDTWTWDGSSWTQRHPAVSPPARSKAAMAFDATHGELVLFGGLVHTWGEPLPGSEPAETWLWDGATWHKAITAHTPPADLADMGYDPTRHQLLLVTMANHPVLTSPPSPVVQTWAWTGADWTLLSTAALHGVPNLSPLVWDALAQRLVLLTEELDTPRCVPPATAVPGAAEPAPPAGAAHGSAGWSGYSPMPAPAKGTGQSATPPVVVPCATTPGPSTGSPSGGLHCGSCPLLHQWSWDGAAWRETRLGANDSFWGDSLASDPATGRLIAFDARDTWTWDGSKWTPHANPSGLRLRNGMALAADPAHHRVVLFGGAVPGELLGDTWTWDGHVWTRLAGVAPHLPHASSSPRL